jgi:AAA domain, putative AbiEii toxin, Type IV TA system
MVMPLSGELYTAIRLLFEWVTKVRFVGRTRRSDYSVPVAQSNLLRSDGSNVPRFLQNLLNNHARQWEELKSIYRELIPSLSDVFMPIQGDSTSVRVAVTDRQDADTAFALENMGAGTTHLATMIAMVWSTPQGGLCLLEEPEQGLHSSAQRELVLWLIWHAQETQKQLIIATHSSIFARPSPSIAVNLATYSPQTGTNFRRINPDEAPVINDELGARLTDFYAYDVLLFVEGDSEDVAIPILTTALSINLPDLGVRVIPLLGDPAARLTRLREYLAYLGDSQVIPYVILDSDKGVADAVDDLVQGQLLSRDNVHLWKRGEAPGEFEDNFVDAQLISAANAISAEAGVTEILTEEELAAKRHDKPKTMTSKLLQEIYFAKHKYGLPKVSLSKKLAILAAADIAAGNRSYQFVPVLERVRTLASQAGTAAP